MWKNEKGPRKVNYVWVLAGVYLLYLGSKLVIEMLRGTAVLAIWKFFVAAVFLAIGVYLCLREWKIYRFGDKNDTYDPDEMPDSYYNNIEDNFAEEYEKEHSEIESENNLE